MRERPILFSTPMVQAILAGRKTQTRRLVKPQPGESGVSFMKNPPLDWGNEEWKPWFYDTDEGERISTHCPYGEPGDTIWVRETWFPAFREAKESPGVIYKADYGYRQDLPKEYHPPGGWKPNIHMSKVVCRLRLEITAIRVERLNDISEDDAISEGILCPPGYHPDEDFPSDIFAGLWEEINGRGSWDANPWVWVIEFKPLTKQ